MKTPHSFPIPRLLLLTALALTVACTPPFDAPKPGSINDPTRPDAPPQVIYLPEGIEVTSLAIDGDHLYATSPTQDQVYRFDISSIEELSRTASAVPYVTVPGASGIVAGANNTLFIGSSGPPKAGALEHKWTSDQVIYVTQASESWHARFQNDPAQKLFVAPRGSFNALTLYNGNLYYAAQTDLEGMTINTSQRISATLGAIENLVPKEFQFLVDMAFGNADFSNIDIGQLLHIADQFNLTIDISGFVDDDGNLKMDLNDLPLELLENFITFDFNIDVPSDASDFLRLLTPTPNSVPFIIPIDIYVDWNVSIFGIDIPIKFPIKFDLTIYVPIDLTLTPQWALHLVTLWYGELAVDESIIKDLIDGIIDQPGFIDGIVTTLRTEAFNYLDPYVRDFVYRSVREAVNGVLSVVPSWIWSGDPDTDQAVLAVKDLATDGIKGWIDGQHYVQDAIDGAITANLLITNLSNYDNILNIISEYRDNGRLSLNGLYKDQPNEFPQRPYLLGLQPWDIDNGWAPNNPAYYGIPISPKEFFDEDRTLNQKLALTLHLMQFKDPLTGDPFSLINNRTEFDDLVLALDNGNILSKIKGVVEVLDIANIQKVINNTQIIEYLKFVDAISQVTGFNETVTVALDALYELLTKFDSWGVNIPDFQVLLQAWEGLPDWGDLGGTRVGSIAPHELLGSLYQQMDNFVEGLGNPWSTVAGWVTSKIPRVNSANGWWYDGTSTNPTGIAFGDIAGIGPTAWVVDRHTLYSRQMNYGPKGSGGKQTRDDYPYTTEYPQPSAPPWTKIAINRWELDLTSSPTGQDKTNVTAESSVILSDCNSVLFDYANGGRVLVSCDDGAASKNKGRVVSVTYRSLTPFGTTALGQEYGFYPPPPRIPLLPATLSGAQADYDIYEFIPADGTLNNPTGMAIKGKYLFIADGNRIVVYYMGHKD